MSVAASVFSRVRPAFQSRARGVLLAFAFLSAGCGGSGGSSKPPEPSVASTLPAQEAFRRLEARFSDLPPDTRVTLSPDLRAFLRDHSTDDRARLVRLYLAWAILDSHQLSEVEALAAPVRSGPPGSAHDLADVIEAAAKRRSGHAEEALALLEPLRGKISDPLHRALFSDELVHSFVDRRRFADAMGAMLDWAEQTAPTERDAVVSSIEGILRAMPPAALEAGLVVLADERAAQGDSPGDARTEARRWLETTARERLVRVALTEQNSGLARRLVDAESVQRGRDESREALEALASTGAVAPRVSGRAIGMVLDVTDETAAMRSSDAVSGMTRALGLPATAARPDAVRLLTRDASEEGDMMHALASLAGDGAGILVAGVTDAAAISASLFAEQQKIPVIVLRQPAGTGAKGASPFTFVLGESPAGEEAAIRDALSAASAKSPGRVGPGGVPCDTRGAPGEPRFPTKEWKRSGIDALLLLGDVACTHDAIAEASAAGLAPLLVLGLESAHTSVSAGTRVVSAGRFPLSTHALLPDERDFIDRAGGAPSWYATLGHDAAELAAAVLSHFPLDRADDVALVTSLHARAARELSRAKAALWSTDAAGFAGANVIARTVRTATPLPENRAP